MSTLPEYIRHVGASRLAADLGVSKQLVSHWRTGRQRPSPRMARLLQEHSGGQVSAQDLRPDVFGAAA